VKVLVAMSGGVDSSVAAALMKDAGHQVMGVAGHHFA
jgi:tRNA U34 2-thiouridine synthase MnmA/TrmU